MLYIIDAFQSKDGSYPLIVVVGTIPTNFLPLVIKKLFACHRLVPKHLQKPLTLRGGFGLEHGVYWASLRVDPLEINHDNFK